MARLVVDLRGLAALAVLSWGCGASQSGPGSQEDTTPRAVRGLKNAASFADIDDDRARSVALFLEASKVMGHARCVNCHPAANRPLQTDAQRLHNPPVVRAEHGRGAPGMRCNTCHQAANVELAGWSVPGHPAWHLAPATMGWQGKSPAEICTQIKDPARNGGKDMDALVHHMSKDTLVGWAWNPGSGREPAPGTQEVFGALVQAWSSAGAHCPEEAASLAASEPSR